MSDSATVAVTRQDPPEPDTSGEPVDQQLTESRWQATLRFARTHPLGACCIVVIVLLVLVAALAPVVAPYDPLRQHRSHVLEPPNFQYLLGTDNLGRDVLSRVIYGARTSLLISVITITVSFVLGTAFGVLSGFIGKALDISFQRLMDAIESIPPIVLLLFVAVALGPSIRNVVIALCIVIVPGFNRIARAEALRLREETYVESARATGAGVARILRRHVFPNMFAPMFTVATLAFGGIIIAESALSFLGIGTPPPTPSWGRMLSAGRDYITSDPWMVIVPAIAISLAVFVFNLVGDALRDHFDPKMQE